MPLIARRKQPHASLIRGHGGRRGCRDRGRPDTSFGPSPAMAASSVIPVCRQFVLGDAASHRGIQVNWAMVWLLPGRLKHTNRGWPVVVILLAGIELVHDGSLHWPSASSQSRAATGRATSAGSWGSNASRFVKMAQDCLGRLQFYQARECTSHGLSPSRGLCPPDRVHTG